jgi:spore germination protein YaaH
VKKILIILFGIIFGLGWGYLLYHLVTNTKVIPTQTSYLQDKVLKREVIGFLPFWLINKAKRDYSDYVNNLTYFSLTVEKDGTIRKYTKPVEGEPGYFSLINGKASGILTNSENRGNKLSLSVFNGNDEDISKLIDDPSENAANLVNDVVPIMHEYHFSELNLDIEQVSDASEEARTKYVSFVKNVKDKLKSEGIEQLSVDVTASSFVKNTNLSDPKRLEPYVNKIIIMAYDFHFPGSFVTGPVAPLFGAGKVSEYDVETTIKKALEVISPGKLILGIPLYGYEWESIGSIPRSAVISGTSLTISNSRAEDLLEACSNCISVFDDTDKESYIIYKDDSLNVYHQVFYPNNKSTQAKLDLADKYKLGGVALWALGYEGKTILEPLYGWSH